MVERALAPPLDPRLNPNSGSHRRNETPSPWPVRRSARPCQMKRIRYSAVELLVALGLLFVTAPFIEELPAGGLIEAGLMSLVMISAVLAVGGDRGALVVALLLLLPALAGKWIDHLHPELLPPAFSLAASMLFFGYVIARLLRFLVRSPQVNANVLCAGISGYLILGLAWAPAYLALDQFQPGAFNLPADSSTADGQLDPFSAFYFSFTTLCTVGYGDLTPATNAARMLAMLQAISGLFYMAVMISRLVNLHASASRTRASEPPSST